MKVLNLSINILNSDVRAAAGVAANIFFIHVYLSTNILGRTQTVTSHIAKVHDLPVCVYFLFLSFAHFTHFCCIQRQGAPLDHGSAIFTTKHLNFVTGYRENVLSAVASSFCFDSKAP